MTEQEIQDQIQTNNNMIQGLLFQQAQVTAREVATACADLCDKHRGHLSIGDIIRDFFKLNNVEDAPETSGAKVIKPKLSVVK